MELIVGAFIFYFVIKYAVRNAIIEAKVQETELSLRLSINDLLEKVISMGNDIIINTKSKSLKVQATVLNDECLKISTSEQTDEEKFAQLKSKENEMVFLKGEMNTFETEQ